MQSIVECVPNFSEGRKLQTIERLMQAVETVDSAVVLDMHRDADHNRSVITFVASPEAVVEAAFRVVALAAELIDLRSHSGQHPRIGATDVLPFVPVRGVMMDECVNLAHKAGARIWQELSIPVYFYEQAALRPDRVNLEDVRRKGFEQLRDEISVIAGREPDIGELHTHDSAGAIAIGARPFLIAFNINLRTNDISIARQIARAVRARHGGLPFLKALGFELGTRGLVQVSMNLVNYETTGLGQAYEAVRQEAHRLGVEIAGTEIVGLVPEAAIDTGAEYFSLLENFEADAVIEHRLIARQKTP
jgi:glutamate formiminotransferase